MRTLAMIAACAALAAALTGAAAAQSPGGDGITIVRDGYGVPHVYADTQEAVSYGAGYALAQDRLWQMHAFRRIAKGRLSEIFGPVVVDIDKTVRFMTYTEAERARRFETYPPQIRSNLRAFVDGINAWIDEVRSDPTKLPFEFAELAQLPIPDWTVDDSLALQDVLILSFGSGGGDELRYAALLQRLIERNGEEQGRRMFDDLVRTDDPDAAQTIPDDVAWEGAPTGARAAESEASRALEDDARLSLNGVRAPARTGGDPVAGLMDQLELVPDAGKALRDTAWLRRGLSAIRAMFSFGSNAQIVDANLSESGNTLQTGGPQVGYMVPQWLADFGLHGGGIDTTGMTFAGAGPAVLIGRGPGYAWTTTTGSSDLTDTYVERLAEGESRAYVFNGETEPMECRTETYAFHGVEFDEQEICRTRHGPVTAFDEANGVAYSIRYGWFNREGQTLEAFFGFNDVHSLEDYATAANKLASNHNMFYSDDQGESAYWTPGNHPLRAEGVDLRLPQDGTGSSEWRGLRPIEDVPHALNPERGWMANWNNQPAAGWERERAYSTRDNVDDLFTAFGGAAADPDGGPVNADGHWDFDELSANLRHGAMKHHRETWYRSSLPSADALDGDLARQALDVVRDWDGFLTDRDGDGRYDSAGERIVDRWLDVLRRQVFEDDLGGDAGIARTDSELWHVISPDSTLALGHDWLNGADPAAAAADAFERAVADIAAEEESSDPASWRREIRRQRYQHLNADFPADLAAATACDAAADTPLGCPAALDPRNDTGLPGDIPEHIQMDRGTYNHVIQYLDPPRSAGEPIGHSGVQAGSVIPPGQSGFISLLGQESPHHEDQLELYVQWRYKPMPLTDAEVRAHTASTERLAYPE